MSEVMNSGTNRIRTYPGRLADELEARLVPRRSVEALHHKGRRAHGHGDFMLRHHRVVAPVLGAMLRLLGIYRRGVENALRPRIKHLRFAFPGLPTSFNGFRILHLSDFHIDGMDGLAEVITSHVSRMPCDLCVMTGDYRFEVEGPCDGIYPRMRRIISSIQARHGILAILGNHDCAEIALKLEDMGVRVLVNEAVEVTQAADSVWLIGVDDPHYYGSDNLTASLQAVPGPAFKILLAHSPEMFAEASAAGVQLYLCGHTHAGQIILPWLGPPVMNAACPRRYAHGEWKHSEMQGHTTAGLGCSMLPVRYGCPPEIVMLELAGDQ